MSKSDDTRARILSRSARLFADKGFRGVTMQDICEATNLSRGGLYRYYKSTSEIISALIESEQELADIKAAAMYEDQRRADDLLDEFLESQKKFITSDVATLEVAISQFALTTPEGKQAQLMRMDRSVVRLAYLIRKGQAEGIFGKGDADTIAYHSLLVIAGLREQQALTRNPESVIDEQIRIVHDMIVCGDPKLTILSGDGNRTV